MPARQQAMPMTECCWAPFTKTFNVSGAVLSQDVASEMIAPHAQCHFEFYSGPLTICGNNRMIWCAILESIHADQLQVTKNVAEPEMAGVEQVRAEIRNYAGT